MKLYRFAQAILAMWLIYKFVGILPEMRSGGLVGIAGVSARTSAPMSLIFERGCSLSDCFCSGRNFGELTNGPNGKPGPQQVILRFRASRALSGSCLAAGAARCWSI